MDLIGRRRELEVVGAAFTRAVGGRRTVVLVRGEAGIGKTSLLDALVSSSLPRTPTVVRAGATEIEADLGWAGLAGVLRSLDPERLEGLPSWHREALDGAVGRAPSGSDPGRVAVALAELLRSMSSTGPVVVVLDDVQWLDRASAAALAHALRHLDDRPVLVLAACRPVPLPIELERIAGDDLVLIEPSPLSLAAARLMIEGAGLRLGRADLVRLHEGTGGNPFHLTEAVGLLRSGASLNEALVPASLREIVDVDLRRLPAEHVEVLAAAASVPQPTVTTLVQLFDADRAERALTAAEELEIVRVGDRDESIEFRHPLLRSGLADRLSTLARRRLHRRCADLDVPAPVRAFHLAASVSGVDPAVADELERAALEAREQGLRDTAVVHIEAALVATDPTDAVTRRRRELVAARLALAAGEAERSLALVRPWMDEVEACGSGSGSLPDDAADVAHLCAQAVAHSAGTPDALPLLRIAYDLAPWGSESRAAVADDLAIALLHVGVHEARRFLEAALGGADPSGVGASDERLEQVLATSLDLALALAGEPLDRRRVDPSSAATVGVLEDLLAVAVWTDDHAFAESVLAEAWRRSGAGSGTAAEHNILQQEHDLRTRQGRLAEAAAAAERSWLLATDEESAIGRSSDIVVIASLRGDTEAVDRHLRVLAATTARSGTGAGAGAESPIVLGQWQYAAGVAALAAGRSGPAIDHLTTAMAAFERAGLVEVGALPVASRLVEALVLGDRLDEAERVAAGLSTRAERSGRVRSRAEAARALAEVRAARGDLDTAADLATEALSAFESLGMPIERVRTQLLVGAVARRRRRRAEARAALEDAREVALRCGALGMMPRIEAELDRLGERVGDGELTRTERQVVELVVRGRSNAEIGAELHLSVRTVESNLSRVYRKLGVRGRAELIARHHGR